MGEMLPTVIFEGSKWEKDVDTDLQYIVLSLILKYHRTDNIFPGREVFQGEMILQMRAISDW